MGNVTDLLAGVMALWFMLTVFRVVTVVNRMTCDEFLRRYRGVSVSSIIVVLLMTVLGSVVLFLNGGLTSLFLSSILAVDVTLIGFTLYMRWVLRVCRLRVKKVGM